MATAAASGDDDEWVRHAYHNPDLVAAVLLSFRLWCPEAEGDEKPSTSAPPSVCALEWGTRRKRSRLQIPRIFPLTQEEEEEAEERKISAATAAAEVEAEEKNRKEKKRRASPQSPLEGYSSASASGGEEGAKAGRSAGVSIAGGTPQRGNNAFPSCASVAHTNTREPTVSCFIRWPPTKKMTKVELQAVQTSLLEEKAKLVKEMEIWRRALEQLREENGKLKSLRRLPKPPVNNHHTTKAVQQLDEEECQPVAPSIAPGRKDFIELPDLNDLPTEC
ncbi:uncharacterized protein LOC141829991 isoform X2 [Curcuma longa]|uniref:uncharacterized protein LOC141829991 isoform X2 n=1 Tax=Curcuma longa TaxID=136217 RepID=UPI003D9F06AF